MDEQNQQFDVASVIPPSYQGLPSIGVLFRESWELYKKLFFRLTGIVMIIFLLMLPLLIIGIIFYAMFFMRFMTGGGSTYVSLIVFALLYAIVSTVMSGWMQAAVIVVLRDASQQVSKKEILKRSFRYIFPLFMTSIALTVIVLGGYFLLLIPGILFSIWFSQYLYIVVCENISGLAALQQSREYFRGRFFQVLFRQIALYIPFVVVGLILALLPENDLTTAFNGVINVALFVLWPFLIIYSYVLYTYLRSSQGKSMALSRSSGVIYLLTALVGIGIFLAFLLIVLPKVQELFLSQKSPTQTPWYASVNADRRVIRDALEAFYADNGYYPQSLDELSDQSYISSYSTKSPDLMYQQNDNRQGYSLCIQRPDNVEDCVTSP